MHTDTTKIPEGLETTSTAFLEASLSHILRHESASQYFEALGDIARRTGFDKWIDTDMPFWILGRSVWNAAPLPSQGFKPATLPQPRRNDPCPCESGKKFKRCCQPFLDRENLNDESMALAGEMAISHRCVSLFTHQQRQAALEVGPPRVRLAVAVHELDNGHPGKARKIALSLLERSGLDQELQLQSVQLLGEAYEALGHETAGEKTFNALLPDLKLPARSAALQWLAIRRLQRDRPEEAMLLLMEADLQDPGNLVTGLLLVTCLRVLEQYEVAQATASEWLPAAKALGDEKAIAFLEEQASLATLDDLVDDDDGIPEADDDLLSIFGAPDALLRPITDLLKAAQRQPLYPVHFDPGPDGTEAQWVLILPPEVEKAQAAFYRAGDMQSPLDPKLIGQHPALLQSPDFLEQLDAFAGASLDHKSLQREFNEALYGQQDRLLTHILTALPPGGQLPWAWLEHRPVLRMMMQSAMAQEDPACETEMLSRVLTLCPNDNLGVRAPLVNAFLREGKDHEALDICESFPDDVLAETRYGRVLALVRLNRLHDAEAALKDAYQRLPKVLNYLVANKRKQPKLNPHGITIGGSNQAWYYRQDMRGVFAETTGMLSWLDGMKRRLAAVRTTK